jgi:protein-S-isoprenylcysteine O-methyltransferase Ste14
MNPGTHPAADDGLVARSLARLAEVPLPPPPTDAAALLRRFRFLQRAQERGRADAAIQRPLAAGYGLAAALLIAIVALPLMASVAPPPDASTAAILGSLTRLLVWPIALVAAALLLAAGILGSDA